jgi:MFS family permease
METAFPLAGNGTGPRWLPPALRIRSYRWYWSAQWPVLLGTWMQTVALGYFVYTQTRSVNAVAFVAAASGLPALALSVFGGALADRYPRRRILLVTQSTLGLGAATLAILASTGHFSLGAIVVVAVVFGSSAAVDLPTSQALVADLVRRELVVNAMALAASAMSVCRLVGPSIAGVLYAVAGPGACFACLAIAYLAPISVLWMVVPDIAPAGRAGSRRLMTDVGAGFAAAWRAPLLRRVMGAAAMLSLLGVSYMPFLPVLASSRLHVGSGGLGLIVQRWRGGRSRRCSAAQRPWPRPGSPLVPGRWGRALRAEPGDGGAFLLVGLDVASAGGGEPRLRCDQHHAHYRDPDRRRPRRSRPVTGSLRNPGGRPAAAGHAALQRPGLRSCLRRGHGRSGAGGRVRCRGGTRRGPGDERNRRGLTPCAKPIPPPGPAR